VAETHYKPLLDYIAGLVTRFGFEPLENSVDILNEMTGKDPVIDVAVLGEFKSGKSSFLNSIVEQDILPVGVVPVTTVICRLAFGDKNRVQVVFSDDRVEEISFDSIDQFVDEKYNPKNRKKVRRLDVMLTAKAELKGLRLIDTPGIGSAYMHNTSDTEMWIPNAGFALITISSDRPLGESDIMFVRKALDQCPELAIVLTKTDRYSSSQVDEISAFIKNTLKKEIGHEFSIYPYSIINDTQSARQRILTEALLPLAENLHSAWERIFLHKIHSLFRRTLDYLQIAFQSAQQYQQRRGELKRIVFDTRINTGHIRQEISDIAERYKSDSRQKIWEILEKHEREIIIQLVRDLKAERESFSGNLSKAVEKFREWLEEHVSSSLLNVVEREKQAFIDIEKSAREHFSSYMSFFHQRLNDNLSKALNVTLAPVEIPEISLSWSQPDISIDRVFDFPLDLLWFLFPMKLFKGIFMKYFAGEIPREVDKNLHRLTSDLTGSINSCIEKIADQSKAAVISELETVERLLGDGTDSAQEISAIIDEIKSKSAMLFTDKENSMIVDY
jgi:GTP-binding protein EngB required for normal cell division